MASGKNAPEGPLSIECPYCKAAVGDPCTAVTSTVKRWFSLKEDPSTVVMGAEVKASDEVQENRQRVPVDLKGEPHDVRKEAWAVTQAPATPVDALQASQQKIAELQAELDRARNQLATV